MRVVESPANTVRLPTTHGDFDLRWFPQPVGEPHVSLSMGLAHESDNVALVRVHSECMTGDVFGSQRCDCNAQLNEAMRRIAECGYGALVYLRQEGRGIGLANKLRAYALQERGLDTVDANLALGLPVDARDYRVAADILVEMNVVSCRLLTNNPGKIEALLGYGIDVVRESLIVGAHGHNAQYLNSKQVRMGHLSA